MKNYDSLLANRFSKKVNEYEVNAKIQKIAAKRIAQFAFENCQIQKSLNSNIIDIASGTGFVLKNLKKKLKNQLTNINFFELDLSFEMLKKSKNYDDNSFKICADFLNLPFEKESFDIVISSFALQWITDFELFFKNIAEILKNNGFIAVAVPTLKSFRNFSSLPFRINKMPDADEIKSALVKNQFVECFYYEENFNEIFKNPIEALKSFKKIGANNIINISDKSSSFNYAEVKNFYLKNYDNNLSFNLDWAVSYFIFLKNV